MAGAAIGVFIGLLDRDAPIVSEDGPTLAPVLALTSTTASVAAGRLPFCLGLHGPCISVDTACSTALVTMHLAYQAVTTEHDVPCALSASASMRLHLDFSRSLAASGFLSTAGRCKTFDHHADGYVRGESVLSCVVQRCTERRREALAHYLGSAVRHDGRSASLTAPNGEAQRRLLLSVGSTASDARSDG